MMRWRLAFLPLGFDFFQDPRQLIFHRLLKKLLKAGILNYIQIRFFERLFKARFLYGIKFKIDQVKIFFNDIYEN